MADVARILRTAAARSPIARQWAEYLETFTEPGTFVPYSDLAALTGENPQEASHLLRRARYLVHARTHRWWVPRPGKGVELLAEQGKVGWLEGQKSRLHRLARKAGHIGYYVDHTQLSALEKHQTLGLMAVLSVTALVSDARLSPRLEATGLHQQLRLTPADYVDLFKGL